MVGIREIASKAGVSISTVSYALNGSSKVTEETRSKIMKIAMDLHYVPNFAGRTLKKANTKIIGMYIGDFGGDFYSHVADGVAQTLRAHHYELIVGSASSRARAFIPQKLVDGAIILDTSFPDDVIIDYATAGNKIVVMDRELAGTNIQRVLLNNKEGSKLAVNALLATNSDHYIFVSGPADSYDAQKRLQAALQELELKTDETVTVIPTDFTIEGGRKAAEKIAKTGLTNIGIFAMNDESAIGLYDVLPQYGYTIGKDAKIIGFDNDFVGHYLNPQLTTIDYSKHQWGKRAAESLLDMLNNNNGPTNQLMDTRLIQRGSLGESHIDHSQDRLPHI